MIDLLATTCFLVVFLGFATWMWTILRKAKDRRWRLLGNVYYVLCLLATVAIVLGTIFGQ